MYFHEQVRTYRRASKLTLQDVSNLTGISRATVNSIELGDVAPSLLIAQQLARVVGIDLNKTIVMDPREHALRHDMFEETMYRLTEELNSGDKDYYK